VTVTDPRFVPRFLLHYPAEPKLDGNRFSWTNGGGQLTGRTLLPAQASLRAVPVGESDYDKTARSIGRKHWPLGRVEVEPSGRGAIATYFLHVLTPSDAGDREPEFRFAEEPSGFVLTLAGHRLVFDRDGRRLQLKRM
jgi:hypothetical protein